MQEKRKYILFAFIILVIFLPFLQKVTRLLPEFPLDGKQPMAQKPAWTWDAWATGTYQEQAAWYYTQETGFRSWMVRCNDQLYYSLYHISKANDITIGKEMYLYSQQEVREYTGPSFTGEAEMATLMDSLLFVQKHLEADGKKFLFVMAPNKVSVYPEYLPADALSPAPVTPYGTLVSLAQGKKIQLLDLTQWGRDLRTRVPYPLFTRGGMHWSVTGQAFAADTFFHALSALTGVSLPAQHIDTVTWSPVPLFEDNDLARGMNLLCVPDIDSLPYPVVSYHGPPALRVLTIGDSFYDYLFGHYTEKVFLKSSYWFYMTDFYTLNVGMRPGSSILLRDEIDQHDVIVLFACHNNSGKLTRTFVRDFYGWYASPQYREWKIADILRRMKVDEVWLGSLREKAVMQGVPLDTVMLRDAEYIMGR